MKTARISLGAVLAITLSMLFTATMVNAQMQVEVGVSGSAGASNGSVEAQSATEAEAVVCTADAYQCPDGTWVGRTGPNCEFVCPGSDVKDNQQDNNDSMPVEPDGGIGDGALPLDEVLVAEVATKVGVSTEVASEIVDAQAKNENIVDVEVGEEDEVSVTYEADTKILGVFDYPVSAKAEVASDGKVRTSYPDTPWYIKILLTNSQKVTLEEVAVNISAAFSGSVSSE